MLQVIINADDLGLTPGCNAGIIQAMTQGVVTDATLMVNTDYTQDAVEKLRQHGISRVGLHLNLTFGSPILPGYQVPSLVDTSGRFRRKISEAVPQMKQVDIKRELAAQADKFLALGLGLTHLDSHHHSHTYPEIIDMVIELAKQLNVPLRQQDDALREKIKQAGIVTTDFFSTSFYEQGVSLENLMNVIRSYPHGTLEIMCHPAEHDPLVFEISSYNSWRERELAILTSPAIKEFIRNHTIRLIGFDDLTGTKHEK